MWRRFLMAACVSGVLVLSACGGDDGSNAQADTSGGADTTTAADTSDIGGADLLVAGGGLGACAKKGKLDCFEFVGSYEEALAADTCDGADEAFLWGAGCLKDGAVGSCLMAVIGEMKMALYFYDNYDASKSACSTLSGTWSDL